MPSLHTASFTVAVLACVGCSDVSDFQPIDAPPADASSDAVAPTDREILDAAPPDAQGSPDAVVAVDAPATDLASSDAPADDRAAVDDVTRDAAVDRPVTGDAPAPPDARPPDAPPPDARPPDAPPPDAGCSGAAPVVSVTAPGASEMIETCSGSGGPVYYDFRATVTGSPVRQVTAQWRTPDGALAPPAPPPLGTPPYVWRRQVGGMMVDVPPLGIFSGALRGTWRFEVTATDTCGRTATGAQSFTLIYTTRRCPNP